MFWPPAPRVVTHTTVVGVVAIGSSVQANATNESVEVPQPTTGYAGSANKVSTAVAHAQERSFGSTRSCRPSVLFARHVPFSTPPDANDRPPGTNWGTQK